jgi:NAD(P)-dependent dehydrogenase (short-subunit alcohol dehydrogenase family)
VLAWLPVGGSYGVSKAALWSATDSMRLELASRGVQVVGVYFGLVDTDGVLRQQPEIRLR